MISTLKSHIELHVISELYIGTVPAIAGAHTQTASLEELHANLEEVLALCLEERHKLRNQVPESAFEKAALQIKNLPVGAGGAG